MSLADLRAARFNIQTENHALAVLSNDFPEPLQELCNILLQFRIADIELIRGGGGEASFTQRLRRSLTDQGWTKQNISIQKTVDGVQRAATTHEIDHVRRTENGSIALEIEWNNKDPFYDRDLENFQRLHSEGAISVGVIVTRGDSLQNNLIPTVMSCATRHGVQGFDDLSLFELDPTARQRRMVTAIGDDFVADWAPRFVRDKFGTATTHWAKLQVRIERGVGNPCPLLLIGIPSSAIDAVTILEDTNS